MDQNLRKKCLQYFVESTPKKVKGGSTNVYLIHFPVGVYVTQSVALTDKNGAASFFSQKQKLVQETEVS